MLSLRGRPTSTPEVPSFHRRALARQLPLSLPKPPQRGPQKDRLTRPRAARLRSAGGCGGAVRRTDS
eukprot:12379727-Alexandrium_andersonii.AAC.1